MSSPVRLQRPSNLSLDAGKPKSRVTFKDDTLTSQTRSTSTTTPSPRKLKYDTDFRTKRKRAHSCSFYWDHFSNKRRKATSAIVLPTKFLLGGNITDPLNLEALDKGDDIVEKTKGTISAASYKRSSTVRVIIPPNINDPLNLAASSEDGEEQLADAISRQRRRRKTKKRKRRNSEPGGLHIFPETNRNRLCTSLDDTHTPKKKINSESSTLDSDLKDIITATKVISDAKPTTSSIPVSVPVDLATPTLTNNKVELNGPNDSKKEPSPISVAATVQSASQQQQQPISSTPRYLQIKKQRTKSEDKIVSPVVPQPGVERKRHYSHQRHPSVDKSSNPKQINNRNNQRFQYGNYNQYYGYRNAGLKADPRLKLLEKEWFEGKEVLDIGCNIGHITLSIGRDFDPIRIVGIDIDKKLVNIAQKNIHHYVDSLAQEDDFPSSMKLLYGPLRPPVNKGGHRKFPYNVKFYQSNYVLENDALLEIVQPEFDVIICLSVTKWIHLNFGDCGLKRFFRRIFRNLKPGGMLILEPQSWPSYTKKKKITNEIFENFKKIQFFPNQFGEFLTTEVGFIYVQKCSVSHFSRGFERPIYVYRKTPLEATSKEPETSKASTSKETPITTITNKETPITNKETPITNKEASITSEETPITSKETPITSEEALITSEEAPITSEETPITSEETPITSEETPITSEETPITSEEKPTTSEETPITNKEALIIPEERPITSEETSITSEETLITSKETLITSEETSITNKEKPITYEENPITSKENTITSEETPIQNDKNDHHFEKSDCSSPNVQSFSTESELIDTEFAKPPTDCSNSAESKTSLPSDSVPVLNQVPSSEVARVADHSSEVTNNDNKLSTENIVLPVDGTSATVSGVCEKSESTLCESHSEQETSLESCSEKQS